MNQDLAHQLAHQRGVQAAIWGMPAVSLASLREATVRDLGARYNDVVYLARLPLPRHELLTNDESPFVTVMLNLGKGPMVLEVPPAAPDIGWSGCAVDAWMVPLADIGVAGEDAGSGGRYLFLPPGNHPSTAEGYLQVASSTFDVHVALRAVVGSEVSTERVTEYAKQVRTYAYGERKPATATRYIDAYPSAWRTLPAYDVSFFELLARTVDQEPSQEKDAAMIGMLGTIGIRKGAPFLPEGRLVRALEQAIKDARRQMEHYFETPGLGIAPYRPDGHWVIGNRTPRHAATFLVDGRLLIDERAGGYSYWTRFAPKRPRPDVYNLRVLRDRSGNLLKGESLYRLRVPPDVPARDHWSIIAYAKESKTFLPNELDRIGVTSRDRRLLRTDGGSVEVYFGPEAPHGSASNWVPTGGDFYLILWLYGPEKGVLGRSFRLPDLERVE